MTPATQIALKNEAEALIDAQLERFIESVVALVGEPLALEEFLRRIDTLLKNAAEKSATPR